MAPRVPDRICSACGHGDVLAVLEWLDDGGDIDAELCGWGPEGMKGMRLLMAAAMQGDECMVDALIQRGPALDLQDEIGTTALMHAACWGHVSCARALLQAGSRSDLLDTSGTNAEQMASMMGHELVAMLLHTFQPAVSTHLQVGDMACVAGVKARPALNGEQVCLLQHLPDKRRWAVARHGGEKLSLSEANLKPRSSFEGDAVRAGFNMKPEASGRSAGSRQPTADALPSPPTLAADAAVTSDAVTSNALPTPTPPSPLTLAADAGRPTDDSQSASSFQPRADSGQPTTADAADATGSSAAERVGARPKGLYRCSGCGKIEVRGQPRFKQCPRCVQDGLAPHSFCSDGCFARAWPDHKLMHMQRKKDVADREQRGESMPKNEMVELESLTQALKECGDTRNVSKAGGSTLSFASLCAEALEKYAKGNGKAATKLWRRAFRLEPNRRDQLAANAHLHLGMCLQDSRRREDAISEYLQVMAMFGDIVATPEEASEIASEIASERALDSVQPRLGVEISDDDFRAFHLLWAKAAAYTYRAANHLVMQPNGQGGTALDGQLVPPWLRKVSCGGSQPFRILADREMAVDVVQALPEEYSAWQMIADRAFADGERDRASQCYKAAEACCPDARLKEIFARNAASALVS